MAGSKTGSKTIFKHAKSIARLYNKYGASDIDTITAEGVAFGDCVRAIVACVIAVYATDDYPLEIDYTTPGGPEDLGPP